MNKPIKKLPPQLRMICPNTDTNVILTESEFGMSAEEFSAFAFQGRPFVTPDGTRFDVSCTLHEGWAQLTLYCQDKCAGMAALAWDKQGNPKAAGFMRDLSAVTGWKKPWPAMTKKAPRLLLFLDQPFLKASDPDQVNAALNAVAVAGFGLLQHIRRNFCSGTIRSRMQPPAVRLLAAAKQTVSPAKKNCTAI
jgi:hypothetical protein